jgi:hypothetical protein
MVVKPPNSRFLPLKLRPASPCLQAWLWSSVVRECGLTGGRVGSSGIVRRVGHTCRCRKRPPLRRGGVFGAGDVQRTPHKIRLSHRAPPCRGLYLQVRKVNSPRGRRAGFDINFVLVRETDGLGTA